MTGKSMAFVLGTSLLMACASGSDPAPAEPGSVKAAHPLDGKSFTVTEIDGKPVTEVTIAFDKGRMFGKGGCNRYNGPVEVKGDGTFRVTAGMAMTMMACPPPAMEIERAFSAAVEQLDRWVLKGQTLELWGQGRLRIRATATP